MARYIDADALLSRLSDDLPYKGSVKRVLMQTPTADVVKLPCKVGDKVYKLTRNKVKECEVVFVGISADEKCSYFNFVENYADGTFYKSYSMVFDVIGRTIFLTREEAEEALRKEREK